MEHRTEDQGAPPQFSADGHWFWTGNAWVPAAQASKANSASIPTPEVEAVTESDAPVARQDRSSGQPAAPRETVARTALRLVALLVLAPLAVLWLGAQVVNHRGDSPSTPTANTTTTTRTTASFDVRTTTCSEYNAYDDTARRSAAQAMLTVMARNEGVRVTDDIHNRYVVALNNGCDAQPDSSLAVAASGAYVQATGG